MLGRRERHSSPCKDGAIHEVVAGKEVALMRRIMLFVTVALMMAAMMMAMAMPVLARELTTPRPVPSVSCENNQADNSLGRNENATIAFHLCF